MVLNEKHIFGYTCVSSIITIFILIYSSSPKLALNFANDNDLPDTVNDFKYCGIFFIYINLIKFYNFTFN